MVDLGLDKLALIGAVALIVIGPEKLPKVARTVGHLLGRAQRYVNDVKAEVNRSMELEELKKMKSQVEDAAQKMEHDVSRHLHETTANFHEPWPEGDEAIAAAAAWPMSSIHKPSVARHKKNWRMMRAAVPQWYRQRHGLRGRAQSGSARVARFRPAGVKSAQRS
jgi:sec-independent protein translocase protein TatB